ncbi:MAG: hypothetical protein KFKLKKLM_01761 [Flavobacteriales bacterium]|nr:hypothetical protein [Flavobacteriales bacterium]
MKRNLLSLFILFFAQGIKAQEFSFENKVELRGNELGYGIFFYSLYINGEYIQTKKLTRIQ